MTVAFTDASYWAVFLGILTVTCWIAAGLTAVLATNEEIRHAVIGRAFDFVIRGFAAIGIASAVVMTALLVFA
jgi:hypothetical protein